MDKGGDVAAGGYVAAKLSESDALSSVYPFTHISISAAHRTLLALPLWVPVTVTRWHKQYELSFELHYTAILQLAS